jgi:type IV secretory pathway VirB10-like protein
MPSLRHPLSALLLFCCAGLAQAQFVWIAPNGTRQYSDQPPPPGTPASKILKAPGRPAPAQETPEAATTPAPTPAVKPKAPTLAEREADYRKRSKEQEEAERKAQDAARQAAKKAEYCEGLRKNARLYASGGKIADVGPDGQRRFLNDAERAALNERTAQKLNECR